MSFRLNRDDSLALASFEFLTLDGNRRNHEQMPIDHLALKENRVKRQDALSLTKIRNGT